MRGIRLSLSVNVAEVVNWLVRLIALWLASGKSYITVFFFVCVILNLSNEFCFR